MRPFVDHSSPFLLCIADAWMPPWHWVGVKSVYARTTLLSSVEATLPSLSNQPSPR